LQALSSKPPELWIVSDPGIRAEERERLKALEDGVVIAWQHSRIVQDRFPSPDVAAALRAAGIECTTIAETLGESSDFDLDEAVIAWMKAFGRKGLGGGGSFRDRFRLGPLVLWWWAEIYLYHETPLRLLVRDVEALKRIVEKVKPSRIVLVRPRRALESAARGSGLAVEILGPPLSGPPFFWRTTWLALGDLVKMLGTGGKSLLRRRFVPASGSPRAFFLTHASMWRKERDPETLEESLAELYFDGILRAVVKEASTTVVAFGPPTPFRKRNLAALLRDLLEIGTSELPYRPARSYFSPRLALRLVPEFLCCFRLYRSFRRLAEIDDVLSHRGVRLGPEALACFRDTFLRQFPWAIRSYREVEAVLERDDPDVLVLYAESSGLGRAAIAAARARSIPSVAVQHGIMYEQYYSHEHSPDEIEGSREDAVPIPTRTAVFGELAKELLTQRGSYPENRIVVTGSPKFDALVKTARRFDRTAIRRSIGVSDDDRVLVLATRWTAVAPVFEELVTSVSRIEGLTLLVKPHQAEGSRSYRDVLERRHSLETRIVPETANLLELLFASDGLITVDSFASSEALVLGRPVIVLNLPGNLDSLVERGVALGVRKGESTEGTLRALLEDDGVRRELETKRGQYIRDFAFGADGRATERIVRLLLSEAERGRKEKRRRP
jgi:UDP-N-acetylglucosamine 2-epimerase